MRPSLPPLLPLLLALPLVSAQSLTTLLAQQNLTIFSSLVSSYPSLFSGLKNTTLLAPSDAAFQAAQSLGAGQGINASSYDIPSLLAYHQIVGTVPLSTMSSAAQGNGEVLQTNLKNASQVNMGGVANVVGVQSQQLSTQTAPDGGATSQQVALQGGLGMGANVTLGNLAWDGGLVQVLDKVLLLPDTCSKTLSANNVTTFLQYLAKATMIGASSGTSAPSNPDPVGFYDNLTSITCFARDNTAYAQQSQVYNSLNTQQISAAMGWHIFRGVFYASETPDQSVLVPMWGNGTRGFVFSRNESGMWIGESKLVQADWMLKNGVVHILDKPLNMSESGL